MQISFGVCAGSTQYLDILLDSIVDTLRIAPFYNFGDGYEILVIGNQDVCAWISHNSNRHPKVYKTILFEDERPGWITRKKNILAKKAKYQNLCIMHDYALLDEQWMSGVINTDRNGDWQVMINKVQNRNGTRHADWIVDPKYMQTVINTDPVRFTNMLMAVAPHENGPLYVNSLPYDVTDLTHIQYVSGGFFVVKKEVLLEYPFDESMIWGDSPGEDIVWSNDLRKADKIIRFNSQSSVTLQKPGKWQVEVMPEEFVNELRKYYGSR